MRDPTAAVFRPMSDIRDCSAAGPAAVAEGNETSGPASSVRPGAAVSGSSTLLRQTFGRRKGE